MNYYRKVLLFILIVSVVPWVWGENSKDKEPAEETINPTEILTKTADSYYDLEKDGLKRAACYVKCPEITKLFDARLKTIIESTKFEAIIESEKEIAVKERDIPPQYGADARKAIVMYKEHLERQLKDTHKYINIVKKVFLFKDEQPHFEVAAEADKKLTKITITFKQPAEPRHPKKRDKKSRGPEKGKEQDFDNMFVWITKDCTIDKMEVSGPTGKSVVSIKTQKYKKCWAVRQLDITTCDKDDCFSERTLTELTYEYPEKIMLPSSIVSHLLDKKGALIERRDEANPVSIKFSEYQVEIKEKKGK